MSTVIAVAAGLVAALVLERAMRDTFAKPVLQRENYRQHVLPTAAGLVLVAAVIAVEGARSALALVGVGDLAPDPERILVLVAVVAFGFLGLADDLLGDGRERGLSGHVRAALSGRASTGFVKLGGGASVALILAGAVDGDQPGRVLVDAALIALAANMGNLFDRAPGRTAKVGLLAAVPLLVVAWSAPAVIALAVVLGATIGLLPSDLRERSMLGDTGANALGAALGVACVLVAAPSTRAVVAGVLLALTLLSEVVSFSRVIAAVAPLRALDAVGRLGQEPES